MNDEIFKIGYLWSSYHTDKVELSTGAELHITQVAGTGVDTEYRSTSHFGLGLDIESNALKVTLDTGSYKFSYDNRISGILMHLAGYF